MTSLKVKACSVIAIYFISSLEKEIKQLPMNSSLNLVLYSDLISNILSFYFFIDISIAAKICYYSYFPFFSNYFLSCFYFN